MHRVTSQRGFAAALLAAVPLLFALCGCGEVPDTRDRLRVFVNYRSEQDYMPGIPYVHTQNEPAVNGQIRKTEARRDVGGVEYRGERVDVVEKNAFGAPGKVLVEIVARRQKKPEPHIDLYIECAVLWELIVQNFPEGRLCDGETGEVIKPRYHFDAGKYHLKAYR